MKITFGALTFDIADGKVCLSSFGGIAAQEGAGFAEVQVCGENKNTHMGAKMTCSSEGKRLTYVSHTQTESELVIIQRSELVEVKTVFLRYGDTETVRIRTEVKNIAPEDIVIEEAAAFVLYGIGKRGIDGSEELIFTRFTQSHHAECQPVAHSFRELGLFRGNRESQKRISGLNVGSWSTKEEIPQGIIEDRGSGRALMFTVESSAHWYYEIADANEKYYLWLGGPTLPFGNWSCKLTSGNSYGTPWVTLTAADSINGLLADVTRYRRHIAPRPAIDAELPTIFNEYMHLSWDNPTEENTRIIAPAVRECGIKYYVIDCGWHDEVPGPKIYPYVGCWYESKTRFPSGLRATMDYIRSLGMKPGLWIEPEIIGIKCDKMIEYYDDDCFLQRNGKRIAVMNRYFLDYRCDKVRSYMSEAIRRMVEDYGAEYIKCDYNEDCGAGTDYLAFCAAEGLMESAEAFLDWLSEMTEKYPDVIFEGCASGGMRMDYKTLSHFSLVSTSDQVNYLKYPYIAANILSSVLPEQAAVWSYPVGAGGIPFDKDSEWVGKNIDADRTAMNMINSFLGRMHLASHIELLSDECKALVKEGVEYYDSITEAKKSAVPYLPSGFAKFGDKSVISGFISGRKIYLGVWCLGDAAELSAKIDKEIHGVRIAYPNNTSAKLAVKDGGICVNFERGNSAVFVEVDI